jgi:hypothetical protein
MSTFLDRLKQAMSESGATKTDLWRACDISSGAVSQWFSKPTTQLKGKNLLCVARVLNVNPEWLATGEGNKKLEDEAVDQPGKQDAGASLTSKQKRALELMNNLSNEDLKSWLRYGETMARADAQHAPTDKAVDTPQAHTIESPSQPAQARGAGYKSKTIQVPRIFRVKGVSRPRSNRSLKKDEK